MKINIKNLIQKRLEIPISTTQTSDLWLKEIANSENDCEFYISFDNFGSNIEDKDNKLKVFSKYYLSAVFDLSNFIPGKNAELCLYVFTKKQTKIVKISIFKARIRPDFNRYLSLYEEYLNKLEKWINEDITPSDTDIAEFNKIKYEDMNKDIFSPYAYSKNLKKIEELLKIEDTIKLQDCADIIKPITNITESRKVYTLNSNNFVYPIDYNRLLECRKTSCLLKKNDILVKPAWPFKVYLINEEPKKDLYAGPNDYVIRTKNDYSPEYLYLYLKSETAKAIIKLSSLGGSIQHITLKKLSEIDVIIPKRPNSYYKRVFSIETSKSETFNQCRQYIVSEQIREENTLEDILDKELFKKIETIKNENLKVILEEDLKEITSCYNVKAYKATLILCGSVLEAFILDWLNELEPQENWLNKKTYIDKRGKECYVGLDYYISKIAQISTPPWMKEVKNNAYTIKENRNLVHAKLCLKEDVNIDKQLCKDVISYLEEIIKLR